MGTRQKLATTTAAARQGGSLRALVPLRSELHGGILVSTLSLIVLAGCSVTTSEPPTPQPVEFSNAARIQAMLTIHAYYFWPDKRFPPGVRPLPLESAAGYLAAEVRFGKSRAAWSRRRRAIAELAAVGLHRDDFRAAIRELGVDPHLLEAVLTSRTIAGLTPSQIATIVADLPAVAGEPVDCASQWKELKVVVSAASDPSASYTVDINIPLPVKTVAPALDAQNWDQCSKFYCPPERTYLAHLDANGTVVMDPPKPAASEYPNVTLFELFTCPLQDCGYTTFRNLLDVDSHLIDSPLHYQVTYGLDTYLSGSTVTGLGSTDLDLYYDNGHVYADPAPGNGSVVHADKTLLFGNPIVLGSFNAGLQVMQQELASELAEMACCHITDPPPTSCPQ
jgi:hypothetical protein